MMVLVVASMLPKLKFTLGCAAISCVSSLVLKTIDTAGPVIVYVPVATALLV